MANNDNDWSAALIPSSWGWFRLLYLIGCWCEPLFAVASTTHTPPCQLVTRSHKQSFWMIEHNKYVFWQSWDMTCFINFHGSFEPQRMTRCRWCLDHMEVTSKVVIFQRKLEFGPMTQCRWQVRLQRWDLKMEEIYIYIHWNSHNCVCVYIHIHTWFVYIYIYIYVHLYWRCVYTLLPTLWLLLSIKPPRFAHRATWEALRSVESADFNVTEPSWTQHIKGAHLPVA